MNGIGIFVVVSCLTLTACSSSSSSSGGDTGNQNIDSRFPVQLDQRVVSISTDVEKDGSIDQVERFNYDDMGRIKNKTTEFSDGRDNRVTDYVYFDNDLIKIKTNSYTIKYLYENDRVVMRQLIDGSDEKYNEETNFLFDNNGRLVGTLGDNNIYNVSECSLTAVTNVELESDVGLTLNYEGNRLSSITSDDNVYRATLDYNTNNRFTQLSESYDCFDEIETFKLVYDSSGRLVSSTDNDGFYLTEDEFSYDSAGRLVTYVSTDYAGSSVFEERTTAIQSYNDQGLISMLESTTEDNNPGFFIQPSFISTFEYENESCVVAITTNPLMTALLDSLVARYSVNDPLLCNYIVE